MKTFITQENVDDILDAAFYSGIGYWCDRIELVGNPIKGRALSELLTRGRSFKIIADGESYTLTEAKMRSGISQALAYTHMSLEDSDATDADNCVQYALFSELVYG